MVTLSKPSIARNMWQARWSRSVTVSQASSSGRQLPDGAGWIARFDMGRMESLKDDLAVLEVHGDVERLGNAGEKQRE